MLFDGVKERHLFYQHNFEYRIIIMSFIKSTKPQVAQLIAFLRGNGRVLSAPQANALFGVKNLRARMTEIRQQGFRVRTGMNLNGNTTYAISRRKIGQA